MLVSIAMSKAFSFLPEWGCLNEEAAVKNFHSHDAAERAIDGGYFAPEIIQAADLLAEDDPYLMASFVFSPQLATPVSCS